MDNFSPPPPRKKFNRETVMNCIGFGLVGVCFIVALFRVVVSKFETENRNQKVIRVAHWQLENGIRDAIDVLGKEYTKLHPDVRIEQLTIPERIYTNWLITQLIGGTAPDIIEIQNLTGSSPGRGDTDERQARYFLPLTSYIDSPNPYNEGTPLQGLPWRETFLDGMSSNYNQSLLETYGIGLNLHTVRIYYNEKLFVEIFGTDAKPPKTYGEFIKMCEKVESWSRENHRPLTPIASSGYNWSSFANPPMQSQTQQLQFQMDKRSILTISAETAMVGYLENVWNLETPAIQSSLKIANELGQHMTPGFIQLKREDATFYFLQKRSLFIATGSWDIKSLSSQADFPISVFNVPLPDKQDPKYGGFILGPNSEGTANGTPFGVTRNSPYPEIAIDFLKFLSSYKNNRIFSEISLWYPSTVGVAPPPEVKPFAPVTEGYPSTFSVLMLSTDTKRLTDNYLYLLFDQEQDNALQNFIAAIQPGFRHRIVSDLQRANKLRQQNIGRLDSVLVALIWKKEGNPGSGDVTRKLNELSLNQTIQEINYYNLQQTLSNKSDSQP